jgi:hypothetical protein
MDFFRVCEKETKEGTIEIFPDFVVGRSKDLMVRGGKFYALWDEVQNLWSTDEYDVQRVVDQALWERAEELRREGKKCTVKSLKSFGSNGWNQFRRFIGNIGDNSHQLDDSLTFSDTEVKKNDYVSRRLPYPLVAGDHSAWNELMGTLYDPEELAKLIWAIGSVVAGDSKKIQKFLVLYGPPGTGKSTALNIIQKLFVGYITTFEAKALVGSNNAFATEMFRGNPLVAVQHDGDLSKIEDNSKLNSIISHEEMTMNEKYKPGYTAKVNAFLFMGTNKPVRISDGKAGIIRRLIDVRPTGDMIPPNHYFTLMARIEFELGAIAHHCLQMYREMGKNYYNNYRPLEMMLQTDVFFNFVEAHYDIFKAQNGTTLKQAYSLYKQYCEDTGVEFVLPQYKLRDELRNYFAEFLDRTTIDGQTVRSYYAGFTAKSFKLPTTDSRDVFSLVLDETSSIFDLEMAGQPAQLANAVGTPAIRWAVVKTTLADIDTSELHYVKVPENHIVIDFDIKDDNGRKSLERNLAAASEWPPTYGELSKSGSGIHLHYNYLGDAGELATTFSEGIEVKSFGGNSSLRRLRSRCNGVPIADLPSGRLALKEKKVLSIDTIQSEKGLRDLIRRNLLKEIHPGTKPSIDFIYKILEDAYLSGMQFDLTDLRPKIIAFANNSSNQPLLCLKVVQKMRFKSDDVCLGDGKEKFDGKPGDNDNGEIVDERLVFFDAEVFPNLFVVCWKFQGDPNIIRMINPTPAEIEAMFKLKLVGFNNRRYDNHIFWARFLGYNNEQLYKLSLRIMEKNVGSMFGEAFNISYADVYDFSSVKQSLKKFEIDLGILHMELDLPWDEPVDEEDIPRVVEYCCNDVVALEKTFESRAQDFVARQILAELSGLTVNDTTAKHTARIIFNGDRNPRPSFVYTDLSREFPGYIFEKGKSTYKGIPLGEGGYVYAEPGMYQNVAVLDIASMHPTSIKILNLFGEYTPNFAALTAARIAIKRKDFAAARKMLGGKLAPYLTSEEQAKELAYALKIVINIVYGLTSASFDNPFRDPRNKDNIVAKRGSLFMIELKEAVQEQGYTVAHIKTDSIKIPDATPEIIDFVIKFGEKYGYDFEYNPDEDFYNQLCLVNDAVYVARQDRGPDFDGDPLIRTKWTTVGAQFQHPYVYKMLFTGEEVTFEDLREAKSVSQGVMYLDFDAVDRPMFDYEGMHHVGRTGQFVPVLPGNGGGILYRVKDGKHYAVSGTKGYLWLEAQLAKDLPIEAIDMNYFEKLASEAQNAIDFFGPFATFTA